MVDVLLDKVKDFPGEEKVKVPKKAELGDDDGLAVGVDPVLLQPPAPDRHPLAALQLPIRIVNTMLSRRE